MYINIYICYISLIVQRIGVKNRAYRIIPKAIQNKFHGLSHLAPSFCNLWQKNAREL